MNILVRAFSPLFFSYRPDIWIDLFRATSGNKGNEGPYYYALLVSGTLLDQLLRNTLLTLLFSTVTQSLQVGC